MNFKKKALAVTLASAMTLSVCVPTFAAEGDTSIQVNGVKSETVASIVNGKACIKADKVNEVLGIDGILNNGKYIVGNTILDVNTGDYLGIRDLAEAAGYMIGWDNENKTVVVVDVNKLGNESFDIIKKYVNKTIENTPTSYKTNGMFSGNVEVVTDNTVKVPFSGTISGETNEKASNINVGLKLDMSDVYNAKDADGNPEVSDAEKTVLAAIEDSNTKVIYNTEAGKIYLKSTLFESFGLSKDAWLELDFNSLMDMTGSNGMDMNMLVNLIKNGDFDGYVLETLKAMPVDSITSYNDIKTAYDMICKMLGDSSFKYNNGAYTSEFTTTEDGMNINYKFVLGDDASALIEMKVSQDGYMALELTAKNDSSLNSEMKLNFNAMDLTKLYMEYKASVTAADTNPLTAPAEGETVVSLESLFAGLLGA